MNTTTHPLPSIVARYVAAANHHDAAQAAECFTADATVHDESHDYVGTKAIRAWLEETSRKYAPTITVLQSAAQGEQVNLSVAVSGQFPGSPVTLEFKLRLRDGKIAALTIG